MRCPFDEYNMIAIRLTKSMKDVPRDVAETLRVMLVRIGRNLDSIGASKFAPAEP